MTQRKREIKQGQQQARNEMYDDLGFD